MTDRTDKDGFGLSTLADEELVSGATGATRREGASSRSKPRGAEAKLSRGTLVGRYVVIDVLGEGGMGVVYAAYDPELDRKVAIKLLQGKPSGGAGSGSTGDQAWLVREAQALARLAHPNVVAVHDVGTLPGDRVFVAIELVDGVTLREWARQPRSWREVRDVMLAAGSGLAAAHRAGLIHRDFKPENVLVGHDGRARVMDFGLARLQPDGPDDLPAQRTSDLQIEARSPLSESLTMAGSVVGTPAYMAPEIFNGVAASARSDQFAFGVTLYELLFLARPYPKRAFVADQPRTEVKPRDPPKSKVPAPLQRLVMRAITVDPDGRFGSMDDLLAELGVDPTLGRRRTILAGVGVLAVAGVIGATMKLTSAGAEPRDLTKLCKGAERHLAGVWDGEVKSAVRAAFEKTDRPFKTRSFAAVETTLDRYAIEWTTAVTDSCEATHLRGEQTEDVLSLRQDCLDQKLAVLRSFTQLLSKADNTLVEKGSIAANNLEATQRIAQCADVVALKAPTQPTPEIRPAYDKAQAKLAETRAAIIAGNIGRAINAGNEAVKLAKAIPFDPTIGEAELLVGMAMIQVGNGVDALKALGDATWAGLRGKRDDVAADAALYAALATSEVLNRNSEARIWLAIGKASVARAGNDPVLRLRSLETEGIVLATAGELTAAVAAHEQALVLARQIYGSDSTQLVRSEQVLGATLSRVGDYHRARPHYERGLALSIKLLGADHPDVALMHSGLASALHYTGDMAGSHREFERALEIRERVFGAKSPVLIPTLNNMSELYRDEGDAAGGIKLILRAREIVDHSVGKSHPYYVTINSTYGELLLLAGKVDEAKVATADALAAAEAQKSPSIGSVLADRAAVARAESRWAESVTYDLRAIASFETAAGKDSADLYKPLTGLAIAKIELGKFDEARTALDRAVAIAEKAHVTERSLAETRAAVARLPK